MKKKVLFVGSFLNKSITGGVGGQMFACNSLVSSEISERVEWIKLDSTAESNLKIPLRKRLWKSALRFYMLIGFLITCRIETAILFSSNGFSFYEKGMMVHIIKLLRPKSKIIFAPRSGRLKSELIGRKLTFAQRVFRRSDYVICQGESWRKFFSEQVITSESKYKVIKNWIDTSPYYTSKLKEGPVKVLFLAWLEKDKGLFDLIEAVKLISEEGELNFKLRIAGKGKHEAKALELVEEYQLNHLIEFKGWVLGEDKYRLLAESQIFILPSYFEGSPNALIEAMASENACISTTVGAIPDIIGHGQNGKLTEPGDIHNIAMYLKELVIDESLRDRFAKNGLETVASHHSVDNAIRKFNDIL